MTKITVADLQEIGGNSLRGDEDLHGLARKLNSARGERTIEAVLELADKILGTHGVEGLTPDGEIYPVAVYLNTGDTYSRTLVHDIENGAIIVTSWGDFYEAWEQEQAENEDDDDEDEDDDDSDEDDDDDEEDEDEDTDDEDSE